MCTDQSADNGGLVHCLVVQVDGEPLGYRDLNIKHQHSSTELESSPDLGARFTDHVAFVDLENGSGD